MTALLAAGREDFAGRVVGESFVEQFDHMYAEPVNGERQDGAHRNDTMMAGFYIQNNTVDRPTLLCLGNRVWAGKPLSTPLQRDRSRHGLWLHGHQSSCCQLLTFVTAHSAFELTAIVVSAAAGLRLGLGIDRHTGAIASVVVAPRGG